MRLAIALLAGTALMAGIMLFCRRWYPYKLWKMIIASVLLTVVGVCGVKLMSFIESGSFKGLSFFGGVFFVPLGFALAALLLRLPVAGALDLAAPAVCGMLAVMKIHCFVSGCCYGRILFEDALGMPVRFPSREFEFFNALILMVLLLHFMARPKNYGKIYPFFMIMYGVTRFILNTFREGLKPLFWFIPPGHFWSVLSIAIGCVWLYILKKRKAKE